MKKKMAIALIMVLVFSNSMVAFGASNVKRRTATSNNGSSWTYYKDGGTQEEDKDTEMDPAPNEQIVTATYDDDNKKIVYSVDIYWGNMSFKYTPSDKTWDPERHSYTGELNSGIWSVDGTTGTDDVVKVRNHSNTTVFAQFKFENNSGTNNLELGGDFTVSGTPTYGEYISGKSCMKLYTAEGKVRGDEIGKPDISNSIGSDESPRGEVTFMPREIPSKEFAIGDTIGKITVSITNTEPSE